MTIPARGQAGPPGGDPAASPGPGRTAHDRRPLDQPASGRIRVAADIGGTFTDVVAVRDDREVRRRKVASSPDDFARATADGIVAVVADFGPGAAQVEVVVHATTVATNAILEGRGAPTALLTTRGFRDVLELRRARSPVLYDQFWRPPPPLVPRQWRMEVDERILADGSVDRPLDRESLDRAVHRAIDAGVESIAICFLHAYRNPAHEMAAAAVVRAMAPHLFVSVSSEVLPEIGEYERTSTTVINAAIGPIVGRYLASLERRLHAAGIGAPILLMQSNGSVMSLAAARERPASIVESGPAAGVVGAARLAQAIGSADVITLDMGGTTTKASLVEDGRARQTSEYEVGAGISMTGGLGRGRGYALRLPVLDIAEVGAGGGSIVRVRQEGGLRVGPESAGAVPGPAAYGLGGQAATVADATLVLGYLNPEVLAGGAVRLHRHLAEEALLRHVAQPLGLDVTAAAHAVYRVAIATMARAVKAVTTYRGRSPSGFDVIAFGGNGPLFAAELARELEIRRVIVPAAAGLFSSIGLLDADEAQHLVRTCAGALDGIDPAAVADAFALLERDARAELRAVDEALRLERSADVRYHGQSSALTVALPPGAVDRAALLLLARAFAEEHRRTYGYAPEHESIELVNVRVVAMVAPSASVENVALLTARASQTAGAGGSRPAYFGERFGWLDTPLVARQDLRDGRDGPLIVEEYDATTLVPPGCRAQTDEHGLIVIEVHP